MKLPDLFLLLPVCVVGISSKHFVDASENDDGFNASATEVLVDNDESFVEGVFIVNGVSRREQEKMIVKRGD